jgi:hypothetical protein
VGWLAEQLDRDADQTPVRHRPAAPGAYLGHGRGDSKGQQRLQTDSCDSPLTSGESSEQQHPRGHAVYGMQGVRADAQGPGAR